MVDIIHATHASCDDHEGLLVLVVWIDVAEGESAELLGHRLEPERQVVPWGRMMMWIGFTVISWELIIHRVSNQVG